MSKDEIWLKETLSDIEVQMRENHLEGFKAVVKSVVRDAMKALEDTQVEWEVDHNSQELREKFHLLRHYLGYLKRYCEGIV